MVQEGEGLDGKQEKKYPEEKQRRYNLPERGIISYSFDINAAMKRGGTASLVGQSKQTHNNIPSSSSWMMTLLFLLGLGENPSKNMLTINTECHNNSHNMIDDLSDFLNTFLNSSLHHDFIKAKEDPDLLLQSLNVNKNCRLRRGANAAYMRRAE